MIAPEDLQRLYKSAMTSIEYRYSTCVFPLHPQYRSRLTLSPLRARHCKR